eukprot:scpid55267/ scgid28367/ 
MELAELMEPPGAAYGDARAETGFFILATITPLFLLGSGVNRPDAVIEVLTLAFTEPDSKRLARSPGDAGRLARSVRLRLVPLPSEQQVRNLDRTFGEKQQKMMKLKKPGKLSPMPYMAQSTTQHKGVIWNQ